MNLNTKKEEIYLKLKAVEQMLKKTSIFAGKIVNQLSNS